MPVTYSDPNIALSAKAPNPMTGLGEMLGIARGAQAYQSGGIELQRQTQANDERIKLQDFMSNPDNFQTDGRFDLDKINAAVPKIAPYTAPEFIGKMTTLHTAQTQALEAKQGLTQEQRNMIGSRFGVLGRMGVQDKRAYLSEMDLMKQENPDNKDLHKLIDAYKVTWEHMPSGPQLPGMAIAGAQTLLKPDQLQAALSPSARQVNLGTDLVQETTTPSVGGQAPKVELGSAPIGEAQIQPGTTYQPTGRTDVNNQPTAFMFDKRGRLLGEVVIPAGVQASAPQNALAPPVAGGAPVVQPAAAVEAPTTNAAPVVPENAPARLPPGETPETWKAVNDLRNGASNAAQQVPNQLFNSNQIIKLADDVVAGKGAQTCANLTGGYAMIPWGGNDATNLNQLGHYMALQTASLANSAGLGGTDAGRAIAGEMAGNIEWTGPAIKQTARVNRALATGTELFNRGIQNSFDKTKDPFSARAFQNKWSQTLGEDGIQAIQLYDLMKNGDEAGVRDFVLPLGGPNSKKVQALKSKINQMGNLIEGK